MGSDRGNVDDGFAIAALIRSGIEIAGIGSIGGNTSEHEAAANNRGVAEQLGWNGPHFRGASREQEWDSAASRAIAGGEHPLRVVALGPLTNVAGALRLEEPPIGEIILVGSNPSSPGRWPPLWPHESNLTWDRAATRAVFESEARLTIVPLDVVDLLKVGRDRLSGIAGEIGHYIRGHAERWLQAKTRWRRRKTVRLPDLVAAMFVIVPELFAISEMEALAHKNGWIEYGRGRKVEVVRNFDPNRVWARFIETLG